MGDRGNVSIIQEQFPGKGDSVNLYTHWGGSELLTDVQTALKRGLRWNDPSYLARIIFDEMIPAEQHGSETGNAISPHPLDEGDHPTITVDCTVQEVEVGKSTTWAFKDFVSASPEELAEAYKS